MSAISGPVPRARPPFPRVLAAVYLAAAVGWLLWRLVATSAGANPGTFALAYLVDLWATARLGAQAVRWLHPRNRPDSVGSLQPADLVIVIGAEPTAQLRIAAWSCGLVSGAGRVVVLDVLGRASVRDECRRLGLERVDAGGWGEVGPALARVAQATSTAALAVVPVRCALLPDLLVATVPLLGSGVNGVSVPTTVVADPGLFAGTGYDLGVDADEAAAARSPSGVVDGPLVVRTLALRQLGAVGGARPWVTIGRRLAASGSRVVVARTTLALERAPVSEGEALRRRWRAVRADRHDPAPAPLVSRLDAMASFARLLSFGLVPLVAWTGWLPLTLSGRDLAFVVAPWWLLSTVTRRALRPDTWGPLSQLRRDIRTMGADLHATLTTSEEPGPARLVRFQRTTALALVVLGVLAAIPIFGGGGDTLPDLAAALLALASLVMLVLSRDTLWAATERQRRSLPREEWSQHQPAGPFRILDVSPLGMLVSGPPSLQVTDVVEVDLALPLPGREPVPSRCEAVVAQVRPGEGAFVQFDLDDDRFDELLYFTAVTMPMLRRLGVRTRPVLRLRTTVRRAPVPDLAPWMTRVLAGARGGTSDGTATVAAGAGR